MNDNTDFFHWHNLIEEIGDPVDIAKGDSKGDIKDAPSAIRKEFGDVPVAKVVGLVAASGKDFQGEDIDQSGIDWEYFRKSGWINYEHQQGMENVVGYPDPDGIEDAVDAEGNPATRLTMWIILDKRGKEIYDKMKFLQKAGGARQFGFSVEGQALERDHLNPKRITRCRIKNVAITAHPVRDTARVELVKSLASDLAGLSLADIEVPVVDMAIDVGKPKLEYKTVDKDLKKLIPDSDIIGKGKKVISYNDLCSLVRKSFPHIGESDVRKVAERLVKVAKLRDKSAY